MTITAADRPFQLTSVATLGKTYRLTADEAQRLLDRLKVASATSDRVVFVGNLHMTLTPATLGGGPAFTITH